MPVRYGRFEMPKTLVKDENTATETYAKFVAEPFEAGYGHTVGNSLRRVLLSSLEGAAITAVKITGAQHEFATLPGVVEDVTDIVLNLKKVKFKAEDHESKKLSLTVNKEGEVTAGDIQVVQGYDVLNPKQIISSAPSTRNINLMPNSKCASVAASPPAKKTSAPINQSVLSRSIPFFHPSRE